MLSSYNLKNKQIIQISGLILQYCSATTLYRRLVDIDRCGVSAVGIEDVNRYFDIKVVKLDILAGGDL